MTRATDGSVWIFGYGSLVWRPAFAHARAQPASLRGWARRFWQGSTDHRGVPERPGRVVTLIEAAAETCRGIAYQVSADQRGQVLASLDHRERGGYERREVRLELDGGGGCAALVYLATPRNPRYLGPAPLEEIAAQVRTAHGPSGPNPEYVVRLAEALRTIDARDEHVFALEALLKDTGSSGNRGAG